ncbi:hypothetical protein ACS0TY_014830 [Phlomoides rotata]
MYITNTFHYGTTLNPAVHTLPTRQHPSSQDFQPQLRLHHPGDTVLSHLSQPRPSAVPSPPSRRSQARPSAVLSLPDPVAAVPSLPGQARLCPSATVDVKKTSISFSCLLVDREERQDELEIEFILDSLIKTRRAFSVPN